VANWGCTYLTSLAVENWRCLRTCSCVIVKVILHGCKPGLKLTSDVANSARLYFLSKVKSRMPPVKNKHHSIVFTD